MRHALIPLILCLSLASCGKGHTPESAAEAPAGGGEMVAASAAGARSAEDPARYMAYERTLELELAEERLPAVHATIENACAQAVKQQCVILESRMDRGERLWASVRLRASPEGIRAIVARLDREGKVVQQSLSAEDLSAPIRDTAKQLSMLNDYRSRLEALRQRADNDIAALIQINKELAATQDQIESLSGNQAHLLRRVGTEILYVQLSTPESRAFWRPIAKAIGNFGSDLASAIAGAVTALAYLLPWSLLLALLIGVWRALRRRWKRRANA